MILINKTIFLNINKSGNLTCGHGTPCPYMMIFRWKNVYLGGENNGENQGYDNCRF